MPVRMMATAVRMPATISHSTATWPAVAGLHCLPLARDAGHVVIQIALN